MHEQNIHLPATSYLHMLQALFRLSARKVLSVSLKNCNFELQSSAGATSTTVMANSSALNSNCLTVCDSGNPNGYYRLNLSDPRGRETARQLQELAVSQRGEVRAVQSVAVLVCVILHAALIT
jgi:hypothetical protein